LSALPDRIDGFQKFFLVLLRMAIGWHLCFEGWAKLDDPKWSAGPFLEAVHGPVADYFHTLAADPERLYYVDLANEYGLFLVGVGLMLGLFTRVSGLVGFLMLCSYYVASPATAVFETGIIHQQGYGYNLFVDKVLVEALALAAVTAFPTGRWMGLDAYVWPAIRMRLVNSSPEDEKRAARMPEAVQVPIRSEEQRLLESRREPD